MEVRDQRVDDGLESQGMLAAPGAISELEYDWVWMCKVLDEEMQPQDGDTVNLVDGRILKSARLGPRAWTITLTRFS